MLKALAWLVSAILAVVVGSLAVLIMSDRAFFALVTRLVPVYTPYRITLENPRISWLEGRLEVDTLQVHQLGSDGAPMLGLDAFSISGDPKELYQSGIPRADVSADAVLVYINATDDAEDPNPAEWLQYTSLFPRRLSINTLHVVSQHSTVNIFPFSNLYGAWQDSTQFVASAGADYTGRPLVVALGIERLDTADSGTSLAIHGALKPQQGSSRIELDGRLTANDDTLSYRFDLYADYERVQDFLNAIEEDAYPFEGTLKLDGTLSGDLKAYQLDVRNLALDNDETYFFSARGSIEKTLDAPAQLDFTARGRIASIDTLLNAMDIPIDGIGEASAELGLTGTLSAPLLDDFAITTRNRDGLELSASARDGAFTLQQRGLLPHQSVALALKAPAISALEPWLGELPFEPGAWSMQTQVSQLEDAFVLDDIDLALGNSDALRVLISGVIGSLRPVDGSLPDVSGLDLALEASSDNLPRLLRAMAPQAQGFPEPQSGTLSGKIRGSPGELRLEEARASVRAVDSTIEAEELAATLAVSEDTWLLMEASSEITVEIVSPAAFEGLELPPQLAFVDSLELRGRAAYAGDSVSFEHITGSAQALGGSVDVRGEIGDALNAAELGLDVSVQQMPVPRLVEAFWSGEPHAALAALSGRLSASARLSGSADSLGVDDISLSLHGQPSLGATVQGSARMVDGEPSAQLELAYYLDDRELIRSLTGQGLAPGSGTVVLDYQAQRIVMALHSLMGDSDISVVLNATRADGAITRLDADLNLPRLYLPDLIGTPQPYALQAGDSEAHDEQKVQDLDWREGLPDYPLRVQANIGEIIGDNTALDGFTFTLSGEDRRYILEQFDLDYAGNTASLRGLADLTRDTISVSLAGSARELPVTTLAADLGYAGDIEGSLSLLLGLTAEGNSVEAMTQALGGRVAVAVADGHIEGAAYDLLATDLLGWLLSGGLLRPSTDFHCAALNFNIREGLANSDRLYILTDNMIASGNAQIDIAAQQLDIRVQPRARRRSVQMPSSITVRGPLAEPRISISPVAATMDTTAKILFFVPDLLLRLFGLGPDGKGKVQACTVDG